ncbi:AbrB family transcriptional regulator [Vibrio zhugei]|uniref:AbrB family transcriptional regulator n=1 Tax=Vibrio zhugei TaxID=2479546 RepID=A0ABV7CB40_9VIBR|nr:AbrB family transcriptional regulator [Vibrio zhugei]
MRGLTSSRQLFLWFALTLISVPIALGFHYLSIPAAFLLGPMLTAILFAQKNVVLKPHKHIISFAQAVLGLMISQALSVNALNQISQHLGLFIGGVLSVLIASTALSAVLAYRRIVPGTAAIWGSSPGAAAAMTLLAQDYGADVKIVALMQYLRVILVTLTAAMVTHLFVPSTPLPTEHAHFIEGHIDYEGFIKTLILIAVILLVSLRIKLPSGPLMLAIASGLAVSYWHDFVITLPQLLLLTSYSMIGWHIGSKFTGNATRYTLKILPNIFFSITLLIGFCGVLSWGLVRYFGIDPLTAYLAMSPGGADAIAIIAASSHHIDLPFVMAMQTCRLLFMLIFGPMLAIQAAKLVERRSSQHV